MSDQTEAAREQASNALVSKILKVYGLTLKRLRDSRHFEDCWQDHWSCALDMCLAEMERLQTQNANLGRDRWPDKSDADWLRNLASTMFNEHHLQDDTHNRLLQIASRMSEQKIMCEMENVDESHDLSGGVVCIACWNRAVDPAQRTPRKLHAEIEESSHE